MNTFGKLFLLTGLLSAPILASGANAHEVGNRHGHGKPQQTTCREFTQRVTINGRTQTAYGTACQTGSGDWKIVSRDNGPRVADVRKHYKRHHGHDNRYERRWDNDRRDSNRGPDGIIWLTDRNNGGW